jgi:hypothetical protein
LGAGQKAQGCWHVGPARPKISNTCQILKFKIEAFLCSKNIETLHEARLEHDKQPNPLSWLEIPNGSSAIKVITDSSLNFKGIQTLWKKSGKFSKNLYGLDLHKSEFSWHTCMQDLGVPIQVSIWLDLRIRRWEFELRIQTN